MANAKSQRRTALVCLIGASAGAVFMIAGGVWSALGGGRVVYSPEQAEEYEAASTALHAATSGHVHEAEDAEHVEGTLDRKAAVAAARQRFDRAQAALETARFAQHRLGPWLIGIGLAAAIAFGIGYWASQGNE